MLSYSAAGYPYDNAVMESFFTHFKKEAVYSKYPFSTIQAYKSIVVKYIDYYNKLRLHQGIGMITPNLKEGLYYKSYRVKNLSNRVYTFNFLVKTGYHIDLFRYDEIADR